MYNMDILTFKDLIIDMPYRHGINIPEIQYMGSLKRYPECRKSHKEGMK